MSYKLFYWWLANIHCDASTRVRVYTAERPAELFCATLIRMKASQARLLRLIALFKFLKSASLIALSVGAFRLLHKDFGQVTEHWVERLALDPGKHYVMVALERAARLSSGQIRSLGIVGLIYAALFLTEGIGLWMLRRWGEWVTIIITGSLVPVEFTRSFGIRAQ